MVELVETSVVELVEAGFRQAQSPVVVELVETKLVETLAAETPRRPDGYTLVAVDGVDGSGKTTFAGAYAAALDSVGRHAVVVHADDFLNLRAVRHRRGRHSPEGFWLDTYDYDALVRDVLEPFGPGGDGVHRAAATDHCRDARLDPEPVQAPPGTVCIVEGMFLHRRELAGRWDYSVFLDVPFTETARRMAARDGTPADPGHPGMRRYVEGQRLYFTEASPWLRASRVVDNTDPAAPRFTAARKRIE
ncbi:uridine kinase [Specibacter cremeus]|uniref:uridine kinase n=1 Tax=Specibacter cremeus TaxID=1629051 RepID=UPI00197BED32|nr:uridine kinase [Specibacter cremeus]